MALRVSAPANLLLLGEYAVLEEGGMGIAVAPDVRAGGTLIPGHSSLAIHGITPSGTVRWPGDGGLLGKSADILEQSLGPALGKMTLDTSAFFSPDGRKSGLGSSAALVVMLTALWSAAVEDHEVARPPDPEDVFARALATHRAAQGGGSGYDVACSTFGGVIRFTGGTAPFAAHVEIPWLPAMRLVYGSRAIRTVSAVGAYRSWKNSHVSQAAEFLARSNEHVRAFAEAPDRQTGLEVLRSYRRLAADLGEKIGVRADMEVPDPPGGIVKAVGAGNELGVVFADAGTFSTSDVGAPIRPDPRGISWE